MAAKCKRFQNFTDEEIKEKRRNVIPNATVKSNAKWHKVFCDYLSEIGCRSVEYWLYPDDELDAILCKFWFAVRTQRSPLSLKSTMKLKRKGVICTQKCTQYPASGTLEMA